MTAQRRRDSQWDAAERDSGVRPRVRQEDIDTLPPPPPDLEDVHARATVNRKLSPEFLSYLRSFDEHAKAAVDPPTPEPWAEPEDEYPVLEVREEEEEDSVEVEPAPPPPPLDWSALHDQEEVPSFRDHRATVVLVGLALAIVGGAVALLVGTG